MPTIALARQLLLLYKVLTTTRFQLISAARFSKIVQTGVPALSVFVLRLWKSLEDFGRAKVPCDVTGSFDSSVCPPGLVSQLTHSQPHTHTCTHLGTWRTKLVANASQFTRISQDIPLQMAATLAVNPTTAYRMLRDFVKLEAGMTAVFVT